MMTLFSSSAMIVTVIPRAHDYSLSSQTNSRDWRFGKRGANGALHRNDHLITNPLHSCLYLPMDNETDDPSQAKVRLLCIYDRWNTTNWLRDSQLIKQTVEDMLMMILLFWRAEKWTRWTLGTPGSSYSLMLLRDSRGSVWGCTFWFSSISFLISWFTATLVSDLWEQ